MKQFFPFVISNNLIVNIDVKIMMNLVNMLQQIRPDVIVNCAGLTKHKAEAEDPLSRNTN